MTAGRWIKVSEAARQLGVSDETIYRLCKRGRLAYRRDEDTGSWRIDGPSVTAYERARTVSVLRVTPEIVAVATRFATPPRPSSASSRQGGAS